MINDENIEITEEEVDGYLVVTASVIFTMKTKIPKDRVGDMRKLPGGMPSFARRDLKEFVKKHAI